MENTLVGLVLRSNYCKSSNGFRKKSNWFTQKLINYLKALEHDGSDLQNTTADVTNLFEG